MSDTREKSRLSTEARGLPEEDKMLAGIPSQEQEKYIRQAAVHRPEVGRCRQSTDGE